jgi:hypothetical protein
MEAGNRHVRARLQRGRGPETAERTNPAKLQNLTGDASTGPRSGDRGEGGLPVSVPSSRTRLQRGRGPETAESSSRCTSGGKRVMLQRGRGPETAESDRLKQALDDSGMLQRGRGPETAESGITSWRK